MGMRFTKSQQRAIDLRGSNILVSAAAGSGKTAVLVERIVKLVSDPANDTDIDRILVVTFTNAAAAQMRERILGALTQKAEQEPDNVHLQRQLTLIHNAKITTIDSFCLNLIRNHFNEIGLDPDFRTADDGERKLLEQDVLAQLLEDSFSAGDPRFLHCVECFAPGGRENRLEELILQLYQFSMSYPWPGEWLLRHRPPEGEASLEDLRNENWFRWMAKVVRERLQECSLCVQENLHFCEEPDGPYLYAQMVEEDKALVDRLWKLAEGLSEGPEGCGLQTDGADCCQKLWEELSQLSFARLSSKKDPSISPEKREAVKRGRERMKNLLTGLRGKFFSADPKTWPRQLRGSSEAVRALVDLALEFMRRLEEKKREKNLLDFSDMEHLALKILLNRKEDGTVEPTRTALEYREQYREILIDEYQDSNLVQEYLLQSISGEDDGRFDRFMVGDVKQSIYKFRLARPEIFMEKFASYQKDEGPCVRVDLKKNFRSRKEVTDCVNDVFFQLMHRELGGVEYDEESALYPGASFPAAPESEGEGDPYAPEFLVALKGEEKEDSKRLEARMIAAKIHELAGKLPVRDESTGQLRPARYKDIVILLRSPSGWDEVFRKTLEEEGIPVYVTSKTGYFAAAEVQTALNFLRVLNNPLQDIPLFGVMHSPVGGFSDAQIALLRAGDETGKRSLYGCMKEKAEKGEDELTDKCREFLALLARFREYAVYLPIHSLIRRFLEETGYLYTVSALPAGNQRKMNIEMLLARAESFEKTSYSGLFHFIRYMEQMEKYNIDFGETGALDENADIVRIMSIHKSKGLEFPVCFLAGLSKRFNRQDSVQPVILDMDLGIAADWIDPKARTKQATVKKNALAAKLVEDSLGEELRVLYVAMTRAEEKLILTACCKEEKDGFAETEPSLKRELPRMSAARILEAGSYFDLLLPVWTACGREVVWRKQEELLGEKLGREAAGQNQLQRLLWESASGQERDSQEERLRQRVYSRYPHENLEGLFVKTTVSELKKEGMQEEGVAELFPEPEVVPYLPRFVRKEEEKLGGTLRGSAYHRLLELFPFGQKPHTYLWDAEDVEQTIRDLRESGRLSEEYASAVNSRKIAAFLRSNLAERMRRALEAGRLKREQPFVLGISAAELSETLPEEETVLIQGIIDACFEEEDGVVVVDYKTDAVSDGSELLRRYRVQLEYYARALEQITGKRVKEKLIYSFALREVISVEL